MLDGARDYDSEECRPLDRERLARMAEAGNWLACPARRRRRHLGQAIARWIAALAIAAAAAWVMSDWATAALLDEQRLALLGIS
jgi:hypothetical protein